MADLARREPDTVALREVLQAVRKSDSWIESLLIRGDGLLVAVKGRQPLRLEHSPPDAS